MRGEVAGGVNPISLLLLKLLVEITRSRHFINSFSAQIFRSGYNDQLGGLHTIFHLF